jgi:endoglucanase
MHMRRGTWQSIAAVLATGLVAGPALASGGSTPVARAAQGQQCAGDSNPHNASNPLDLPQAPGSNPLRGAPLFVAGPRFGPAAGAIAQELGINPLNASPTESWASFSNRITHGSLGRQLTADHGLAVKVGELAKIAAEPTPMRISSYVMGGTPAGTEGEANKMFCTVLSADPGTIPVINTYYAHPLTKSVCSSRSGMNAVVPRFRKYIDALAAATGNHRVLFFLEEDALGSSGCFARSGTLGIWESMLRYEAQKIGALPHTVAYIEGGYSDGNSASYTAKALKAIGLGKIKGLRGFFSDDTHLAWTINEIKWDEQISRKLHGARYIISTAQNGQGPVVPHNRVKDGNEVLCNPPGRGLGPRPTVAPGGPAKHADAYEWVVQAGNSDGSCNGGTASGTFWTAHAITLAENANGRLGPGYPSQPY